MRMAGQRPVTRLAMCRTVHSPNLKKEIMATKLTADESEAELRNRVLKLIQDYGQIDGDMFFAVCFMSHSQLKPLSRELALAIRNRELRSNISDYINPKVTE